MYCTKCGKQIPDGSSFCPSCGATQNNSTITLTSNSEPSSSTKKKRGCGSCLGLLIAIVIIAALVVTVGIKNAPVEKSIVDSLQYANISTEELIHAMGEPDNIEDWDSTNSYGVTFTATIYTYNSDNMTQEFVIADDKVVRLTCYAGEDGFKCLGDKQILRLFGITAESSAKKIADTGAAIRIQTPCDGVADFWVVDLEDNKCSIVKITFNSSYF